MLTRWRRKPASIGMEQNYVTVTLYRTDSHKKYCIMLKPTQKTNTHLTALFRDNPGEPVPVRENQSGFSLKQETVSGSGSGISWAICKSASRSRQITTPVPDHSVFYGRMLFLPPNQQHQSTDGNNYSQIY